MLPECPPKLMTTYGSRWEADDEDGIVEGERRIDEDVEGAGVTPARPASGKGKLRAALTRTLTVDGMVQLDLE
jgi:hypothetical protein